MGLLPDFLVDEKYLLAATRDVELNPVKVGLASTPEEYRWSCAKAHMDGEDDVLVMVKPLLALAGAWRQFLRGDMSNAEYELLKRHDWKTIWIEF